MSSKKLKLGLPKGSLQDATFALFERAGFSIRVSSRSYHPMIDDETIEPILLRPQEIPLYVAQGVIDAGLTGADWIADSGALVTWTARPPMPDAGCLISFTDPGASNREDCRYPAWLLESIKRAAASTADYPALHELCELGYSKLTNNPIRVVLAVHQESKVKSICDLEGKRIATEYVQLTKRYLATNEIDGKNVEFSWGACEVKVPNLVEAIVVNTETGNSLRANNLKIVDTLLTSTTRFVASPVAMADDWKRERIESLEILLTGAMNAAKLVGLKMNLPVADREAILGILPALKNPTLSPLADPDWIAAEVILSEREVRDLIPALKRAGATGLVEYPLNKVIY